jgi:Lar family restriction alleviation protein
MWFIKDTEEFKLKPCPFCNSKTAKIVDIDNQAPTYAVVCPSCSARIYGHTVYKAVEAWNRRKGS